MNISARNLYLIICCLCCSCSKTSTPDLQVTETTAAYVIEMDKDYKVSEYSYCDSNESYAGDMDCNSEYTYYADSVIVISDSRSVTARGDYSKGIFYLNKSGFADSSFHQLYPGHLSKSFIKHFYSYDSESHLVSDSVKHKDQNSYALYSVIKYEYSDGNMMKSTQEYIGSSSFSQTYTYYSFENLFSLFGTINGKPGKNLVRTITTDLGNDATHTSTNEYELYSNGLIEKAVITSKEYRLTIKYTYNIAN
jgi:hypothetical protein